MGSVDDRLTRIEEKLDQLALSVENRVTKLEVRTGLYGVLGGAIVTIVSAFIRLPS